MGEHEPHIIFYPEATPEQRAAVGHFEDVAVEFPVESELLNVLVSAEAKCDDSQVVKPLASQPDKTEALEAAWCDVVTTEAILNIEGFDDETEANIQNDHRFKDLFLQHQAKRRLTRHGYDPEPNPEAVKREIIRLQFAIYAGRLAAATTVPKPDPAVTLDPTGTSG